MAKNTRPSKISAQLIEKKSEVFVKIVLFGFAMKNICWKVTMFAKNKKMKKYK